MPLAIALWFPSVPVGAFGIVLAVLGALMAAFEFKGPKRFWWASAFIVLGVFESIVIFKADQAHDAEVRGFTKDIESVKDQLHQSELNRVADTNRLQGKLDVFAQFAPAIFRLAQATEYNTRRQYEAKMLSNKDLYDATMNVVKKMRDFHLKYRLLSEQAWSPLPHDLPEAERQKRWREESARTTELYLQKEAEFRSNILPDALYIRTELLRRKIPEPKPGRFSSSGMVEMVFAGGLAGPGPELEAADYLEQMAKQLPLK